MSPSVSVRLLQSQSDERLVGYARAGHERAFEALVQRYRRQLHAYCRRLLLSEQRAEDALQQALLQAWVALRNGSEVSEPRAWLYRIVHNAAVQTLRVSRYDYCQLSESLSGADAPHADLDRRIAVREALAGLAALPEMQREALLRTAVEGDSHRQAAADLGLTETALRGLVYRARASMRAAAGAIVPPPLIGWALEAGTRGTPALERLAGLGTATSGGSAGLAGLLLKGGAVAITAGALAGGIVASHAHRTSAREQLLAGKTAGRREARQPAGDGVGPVAFTRLDTVKAGHPAWHANGTAMPPAKRGSTQLDTAEMRTGEAHRQRRLAGNPPAALPNLSVLPAGSHRGDGGLEPAASSGSSGGHDGGGAGSQQGGTSEHDEQRGSAGGHDGGGGEQSGTSSDQSGQSSGASGGDGSGSESKDGSSGSGSGELQSGSGATGTSGYKDRTPLTESQRQQGG